MRVVRLVSLSQFGKRKNGRYNLYMRRFYPALKYTLLALLVPSLGGALFGTCVGGLIFEGTSCSV